MKFDLTKEEGREQAITELNSRCLKEFHKKIGGLCPDAMLFTHDRTIQIGVKETDETDKWFGHIAFASDLNLYDVDNDFVWGEKEASINFGSSGKFNPTVKASYWRTIHAAALLKKWNVTTALLSKYCNLYKKLRKDIELANPKETAQ